MRLRLFCVSVCCLHPNDWEVKESRSRRGRRMRKTRRRRKTGVEEKKERTSSKKMELRRRARRREMRKRRRKRRRERRKKRRRSSRRRMGTKKESTLGALANPDGKEGKAERGRLQGQRAKGPGQFNGPFVYTVRPPALLGRHTHTKRHTQAHKHTPSLCVSSFPLPPFLALFSVPLVCPGTTTLRT